MNLEVRILKTLYMIGGTMGVGKTTVCQQLKQDLQNSVFLDGDWCWDASPFQVTDETKAMVMDNICYLLNNFLKCSIYENIIFCWVMHEQSMIDSILEKLDTKNCAVKGISLVASEKSLRERLSKDIERGRDYQKILKEASVLQMLWKEVLQKYHYIEHLIPLKSIPRKRL